MEYNINNEVVEEITSTVTTEQPAPKKRGRKPKSETSAVSSAPAAAKVNIDADGNYIPSMEEIAKTHETKPLIPMTYLHVEVTFLEKALGTTPNSKDLLSQFIASKAPDAPTREQEVAALGEDAMLDRSVNIYPKGKFMYDREHGRYRDQLDFNNPISKEEMATLEETDLMPYLYNYQLRGFFKDSCGLLARADEKDEVTGKKKGSTESAKLSAFKKVIDGCIFVFPRRVAIEIPEFYLGDDGVTMVPSYDENGKLPILQRPIRTQGPTGERVAIAASEQIAPGSKMKFTIGVSSPKFIPAVIEWLNYGKVHGISGWRNSGLGICQWRFLKPDYTPYE